MDITIEYQDRCHPTHRTRYSDSSLYDEVCVLCGATDNPLLFFGRKYFYGNLVKPCPASEKERQAYDAARR